METGNITTAVATRLVAAQFPQWADLPVEHVAHDGFDNATFRLGDDLLLRLPNADIYVAQVEKEQRWLPILARHLSLDIPEPVATGRPSDEFPRPWSVYRWIEGEPASVAPVANSTSFASELGRFISELHAIDARGGPTPGDHNFFRGGSLGHYDSQTRSAIQLLAREIDTQAAIEVWNAALVTSWDRPPIWVHGDVAPSNLLVREGSLRAVIDFGCIGIGDPACDLVMAWTFFTEESRNVFRRQLPLDESTWARGRGWALWKALITLAQEKRGGESAEAATGRFGWRTGASEILQLITAGADSE